MRYTDFPPAISPTLYAEAALAYAELVSDRVHAVYQTGSVTRPGISDLDLIVVPVGPRYDNYAYFSVARLPERLRRVFRHGPFILPLETSDIVRYTSHKRPRLVHGRDVLPPEPYEDTLEDRWSMLLEDYWRYHRFTSHALREDRVRVRRLLSKLASIRIPIETFNTVADPSAGREPLDEEGLRRAEEMRSSWFENGGPPEAKAAEAWALLLHLFDQLTDGLRTAVKARDAEDLRRFTQRFLRGEEPAFGADPEAVWRRQQAVLRYLRSVCALRIACKSLLPNTVFTNEVKALWRRELPARPVRAVVRLRYRLEGAVRRLGA